ncbi:uncharacterized protein LOC123670585 [Harmonia axyridis]|uniref:uncharacterized protein LOC123670585 n=1 Tax=Harmonia axyridis TaxID=115357 RepID=UPI001E27785B|nr:uncharacterized protein LOC123670585 [Harmonia axyridis]
MEIPMSETINLIHSAFHELYYRFDESMEWQNSADEMDIPMENSNEELQIPSQYALYECQDPNNGNEMDITMENSNEELQIPWQYEYYGYHNPNNGNERFLSNYHTQSDPLTRHWNDMNEEKYENHSTQMACCFHETNGDVDQLSKKNEEIIQQIQRACFLANNLDEILSSQCCIDFKDVNEEYINNIASQDLGNNGVVDPKKQMANYLKTVVEKKFATQSKFLEKNMRIKLSLWKLWKNVCD